MDEGYQRISQKLSHTNSNDSTVCVFKGRLKIHDPPMYFTAVKSVDFKFT